MASPLGSRWLQKSDSGPGSGLDADSAALVDTLIEERAGRFLRYPTLWTALRPLLLPLLGYSRAVEQVARLRGLSGEAAMAVLVDWLAMAWDVSGIEAVPLSGPAVLIANHPTGIADAFAVYPVLRQRRGDLAILASRDAIRMCPGFADFVVPVEWREERRTRESSRETLKSIRQAFEAQRLVVIFPAGRLAGMTVGGLREQPWKSTAVTYARRFNAPLIPLHIGGQNSWLYYFFRAVNQELRDMTLFHEVTNKRGYRWRLTFGEAIPPARLDGDPEALTEHLCHWVQHDLAAGRRRLPDY